MCTNVLEVSVRKKSKSDLKNDLVYKYGTNCNNDLYIDY